MYIIQPVQQIYNDALCRPRIFVLRSTAAFGASQYDGFVTVQCRVNHSTRSPHKQIPPLQNQPQSISLAVYSLSSPEKNLYGVYFTLYFPVSFSGMLLYAVILAFHYTPCFFFAIIHCMFLYVRLYAVVFTPSFVHRRLYAVVFMFLYAVVCMPSFVRRRLYAVVDYNLLILMVKHS